MRILPPLAVALPLFLVLAGCSGATGPAAGPAQADQSRSAQNDGQPAPPAEAETARPSSPAPAHSSRLSLDWVGTYSGVIPCASCPGIETRITLNKDGTFERSRRYIDASPVPSADSGSFTWNDAGSIVTLNPADGSSRQHYQVGEHRLLQLDQQGRRIEGDLAGLYVLDQHLHDPRIEDRRWVLTELRGQPVEPGEHQRQAFLLLHSEESRLHGNSSCNTFNGSYAIKSGWRIEFSENMAMTMMACPDMSLENQFVEILKMADNYSIGDDGTMTLNRARMAPLARFVQGYLGSE